MHTADDVDVGRRRFLNRSATVVGGVGAAFVAVPFLASWQPSERARAAGAPVEADISKLEPGQRGVFEWRGKPVWVVRRTPAMLATLDSLDDNLQDPVSEESEQPAYVNKESRSINPEYIVLLGVCTHLGCAPEFRPDPGATDFNADWKGGFYCPCHGSMFDLAGRVYKNVPAPTNLTVPPYRYLADTLLMIGEDEEAA